MVVNDEAHHVQDEKLKWNQSIERLHDELRDRAPDDRGRRRRLAARLLGDAEGPEGQLFRHVVVDYPLAQAVADGIVKTPVIGEVTGATVELGDSSVPAQPAVARRRRRALARVRRGALARRASARCSSSCARTRRPPTRPATTCASCPDFAGDRLLVIHTNRSGEITKADLDLARRAAREVDEPDSRIRCIVSVLMLREGWDVRNVCVIVTLRPLSAAKPKILPEQALGRGLRRMTPPGSGFDERVVVIEHDAFRNLWSTELDGGLVVEKRGRRQDRAGRGHDLPRRGQAPLRHRHPAAHARARALRDARSSQLDPDDVPDPKTPARGARRRSPTSTSSTAACT